MGAMAAAGRMWWWSAMRRCGVSRDRTVVVYDVDGVGAPTLPILGTSYRVRVVLLLAAEIALLQADAPAVAEIYSGKDRKASQRLRAHLRKFS